MGYRLSLIVPFFVYYDQSIRALPQSNKLHPWNNCIHLLLSFYRFLLPIFHIRFSVSSVSPHSSSDRTNRFRMEIYALLIVMCYRLSINLTACKRQYHGYALIIGHWNRQSDEIQSALNLHSDCENIKTYFVYTMVSLSPERKALS